MTQPNLTDGRIRFWRSLYVRTVTAVVSIIVLGVVLDWRSDARAQDEIPLPEEALVLPNAGRGARGGRTVIAADPIQAQRLEGKVPEVRAGDTMPTSGGTERKWVAVKRTGKNVWQHDRLAGGYLRVEIKSERERVAIMEVAGHLHALVNGEPRAADPYRNGIVKLPILLRAGANELLFQSRQRELAVNLKTPPGDFFFNVADPTVPDLVAGEERDHWAAVPIINATTKSASGLTVRATLPSGRSTITRVIDLLPLCSFKAPFRFAGKGVAGLENQKLKLELMRDKGDSWEVLTTSELTLRVRQPQHEHMWTFVSGIDGSVQYYAVVRANPGKNDPTPGLTLTLHGAGVEARGQADCYAPKPWTHVVAATNRRPFGFDWEDWGRLDALEVLDAAERELKPDPRRRWLTGHSMGGHGTWHVGVTFPDRFAAIGPSAGWISMYSYAGMRRPENADPLSQLLERAALPSDTLSLVNNTRMHGIYVLHGDKDDNVPVTQARTMKKVLEKFHPNMTYHEQPGAGHWWGNDCVDWKPMFEFFRKHTLPLRKDVTKVEFSTASPGVSAEGHWARIEAQSKFFQPTTVVIEHDAARRLFRGTTQNVARLSFDVSHLPPGQPIAVDLDGQKRTVDWPTGEARVWLRREAERWSASATPQAAEKNPMRYGPFKDAFRNRMLFVYGTKGSADENAATLAKARFDAETFWYRGNGAVEVIPDTKFDDARTHERNVILYGNADTNAAWTTLLGDSPVHVKNGVVRVGKREEKGDNLACLFVRPRPGSDTACVAAVAAAGSKGMRATNRLPVFVSGVAYPDFFLFSSDALTTGASGVRGAGFFGLDWSIERGEFAWRD